MLSKPEKEAKLDSLSESEFRDNVVVALFEHEGYIYSKNVHGGDEEGKDLIFIRNSSFGRQVLACVQVKAGRISMASEPGKNLLTIQNQLEMSLKTKNHIPGFKLNERPTEVFLVASGTISASARKYIYENVAPQILFLDRDDVISRIDQHMPSFWFDSVPEIRRHCELVRERLDIIPKIKIPKLPGQAEEVNPYVELPLYRIEARNSGRQPISVDLLHVKDLANSNKKVLICGDGGSGKTRFLQAISEHLLDDCERRHYSDGSIVPVYVSLSRFAGSPLPLDEYIISVFTGESIGGSVSMLRRRFELGSCVVMLDGLDEVPSQHAFEIKSAIEQFVKSFPMVRMIVASRECPLSGAVHASLSLELYRVSEIKLDQAWRIVDQVFQGGRVDKDVLKELLRKMRDVHGLVLSPFIITLFAAAHTEGSSRSSVDIMPSLHEIFQSYTELMLGKWDQDKGLAQSYHFRVKERILSVCASKMHWSRQTRIPLEEFRSVAENCLQDIAEGALEPLLDEIYRSGLVEVNQSDFCFRHLLFQEFFASKDEIEESDLVQVSGDPWFRHMIVFNFGAKARELPRLNKLVLDSMKLPAGQQFDAIVTHLYTIQALYLSSFEQRKELTSALLRRLALSMKNDRSADYPILEFLGRYLQVRSAFSGRVAESFLPELRLAINSNTGDSDQHEVFLMLTACLDAGYLHDCKELMLRFRASDRRIYLCLFIQLHFLNAIRRSEGLSAEDVKMLIRKMFKKVGNAHLDVLSEFKSYALEFQQGAVSSLDVVESGEASQPFSSQLSFDL